MEIFYSIILNRFKGEMKMRKIIIMYNLEELMKLIIVS